ncbi:type 1 glutamine amidotransferase domain-containing protein [Veronia nyctiphanis]|uniref:Type 1 glutamine amidotransferase domain-containing protein n=1 Tax=Veronia nyctiphanis TaxID=1278244 RepID=A0A4Q0YUS1_9GAMM|nr:type 1 glutamine amidotransferase domain-containing protein [Veronia nyctiphanis]RXJ74565.1 type 1 glutamine amidotransferase domain-containing protein [Veronia nyctiphanis]
MKRLFGLVKTSLFFITLLFAGAVAAKPSGKVLMVLSGHGEQQGEVRPGYEFSELSKAYLVFKQNGMTIDIASPKGGEVEADKYNPKEVYNAALLADKTAMAKLTNTLKLADVAADEYQAVFVVGGKGAMFDLPKDTALQALIADVYENEGTVAAVCHGPAALVNVTLSDGGYLVTNRRVNGFTNTEEQFFGKKWLPEFEFMLQDKLIERGGKFQSSEMMLSHVAVDGRLITGQNPASTVDVASAVVKSLGQTPTSMPHYNGDETLKLVAKYLQGQATALAEIKQSPNKYNVPLVSMYGLYYLQVASENQELENALGLMQFAQKEINNPQLDIQIAKVQMKLGQNKAAVSTLNQLLASTPDFQPALDMLKTIAL